MSGDPWGIDVGYVDGGFGPPSRETRGAILAAMGAKDANDVPADPETVRVVHPGMPVAWPPGELQLEDGTHLQVQGSLPPDLPLGYHRFKAYGHPGRTWVISSPGKCPIPEKRAWGWGAQLYAVRSAESWGMGDLVDLRRLARWSASLGAGVLMLNPLHAAAPVVPQEPSPYYPSSRRFLNPLYLRVEEVPGASELGETLQRLAAAGRALNSQRRIDRDEVFRLKQAALKMLWSHFGGSSAFEDFCKSRGEALRQHATYCVLAERFGADWHTWPVPYRVAQNRAVRLFAEEHSREVRYHQWLQWLLDEQLARAAGRMALVQDLPVGFNPGGADAWAWQDLLAPGISVGAPPDQFNPAGQDWGLPAFVPHKLRATGYGPMIETIRASLRHSKGLRIDHVMGLFRLYWIPQGLGPTRGAYVRYSADELLAIVALESHRCGAFVVGEDLGSVEPQMRVELRARHVLSYRVFWFEERKPPEYPPLATAAATTHDLPTVAGLWTGDDIRAQEGLGLNVDGMKQLRQKLRKELGLAETASPATAVEETYRRLGTAPSLIVLATLEDAMEVRDRPNMPGTTNQWPNWSMALPQGLAELERAELPRRIAAALDPGSTGESPPDTGPSAPPA